MAGTPHGVVNIYQSGALGEPNRTQNAFVGLAKGFDSLESTYSLCTRISSQSNNGANGWNFHDEANPTGENAFATWRRTSVNFGVTYDIHMQWSVSSSFGASPGNPALFKGSSSQDALGFSVGSARTSGGANADAWQGGTANAYADAKGDPVWAPPVGGRMFVAPRSNDTGGGEAASAQNCFGFRPFDGGAETWVSLIMDDDCTAIVYHESATSMQGVIIAPYTPLVDFDGVGGAPTSPDIALCAFETHTGVAYNNVLDEDEASVYDPKNQQSGLFKVGYSVNAADVTNNQYAPGRLQGWPIEAFVRESGAEGLVGYIDPFVRRITSGFNVDDTANSLTRLFLKSSSSAAGATIPWVGGAAPRSGTIRTGSIA